MKNFLAHMVVLCLLFGMLIFYHLNPREEIKLARPPAPYAKTSEFFDEGSTLYIKDGYTGLCYIIFSYKGTTSGMAEIDCYKIPERGLDNE